MLKISLLLTKCQLVSQRSLSSAIQPLVICDKNPDNGIVTVSLNQPPVNSMGLEFMQEIIKTLEIVEEDSKGLILTSANKSVFSAGLNLQEFHNPKEGRLREFWTTFQELWLKLYSLKIPAAAAINGHAPAGGALLATCCDYRVMVASDKFTIGLNEAKFGLVAPFWLMDTFKLVVGQREAELGLQLGKLYSVEEAKQIGLIDEIVDSKEAAVTECARMISEMNKCVPLARHLTKMSMRERTIQRMIAGRAKDIDTVVSVVLQEPMQKAVSAYISSLSGGKSKGKQH